MKFLLVLIVVLLVLHQSSSLEPKRFLVKIGQYTRPHLSTTTVRCSGTVVSSRHVLTTADCATLSNEQKKTQDISVIYEYDFRICK
jgi:hypothetical protein